ncbi:uncharacterized protein LOC131269375 [Anopheles coustani]|uniref:uncharacterized protein LOC131269375 n=1 Tax=Anopheles coustani TaxID=139045 RepID=UPI002657E941|nr:uncharacterized protein LOC131269375 [Anopheles coustani]
MSDPTCFKFTTTNNSFTLDNGKDARSLLQTFGPTYQVFVAPYAPDVVNVKYKKARPLLIKHRPHPSLYSDGAANVAVSNGPKKNPTTEKRVPQKNIENEPQVKQQPQQEQLQKTKQDLKELQNKPQAPNPPEKKSNRAAVPENTKKAVHQQLQQREQNQGPNPTKASNASPQQPSSTLLKRIQKKAATTKRTIAFDPFPPVGSKVAISSVSKKWLHIHEVYGGNDDPFLSYITRCMKHADEIDEELLQPPQEGDIVFAPFDGYFYRAVVTKVEGYNGTVVFPDFGNLVTLPWRQMKEIRDASVKYANCLTHAVVLREGAPFTKAVKHFLNELVEAHQFELMLVEDGPTSGVKTVELRHVESQYLLGAKVRSMTTPRQ